MNFFIFIVMSKSIWIFTLLSFFYFPPFLVSLSTSTIIQKASEHHCWSLGECLAYKLYLTVCILAWRKVMSVKEGKQNTILFLFYFNYFHWKVAFQMPASLRKCKWKSSGQPHGWAETGQPRENHICKNTTLHSPFFFDNQRLATSLLLTQNLIGLEKPCVMWWGDSASLCLLNVLQGMCRAESCPWFTVCGVRSWLSMPLLANIGIPVEGEHFGEQAYWHL